MDLKGANKLSDIMMANRIQMILKSKTSSPSHAIFSMMPVDQ